MTQERCRNGRHTYLSAQPKPRWCIWCNHKEEIEEPKPAAPKKKRTYKKSTKKK
jgi:hypothetical protein